MKIALLQPQFAPNLYDLSCMLQADRVILQDNDPWSRKSRVHRALIRTANGTSYINIPIRSEDKNRPIRDVRIDQDRDWTGPILKALRYNYRMSLYFDHYEPEIIADFESGNSYERLLPFIDHLRRRLFRFMELDLIKKESLASEEDEYDPDPDRYCSELGADTYFQEYDSRHYQRQGVERSDPDFEHPIYSQHFEGFEPWCSLYDILFQFGPESFRIVDRLSGIRE